jgi:hypothetical protein
MADDSRIDRASAPVTHSDLDSFITWLIANARNAGLSRPGVGSLGTDTVASNVAGW